MSKLEAIPLFTERRQAVRELDDEQLMLHALEEPQYDIRKEEEKHVKHMMRRFTIDSFYDFIQNGNTPSDLDTNVI